MAPRSTRLRRGLYLLLVVAGLTGCRSYLDRIPDAHPAVRNGGAAPELTLPRDAVRAFLRARVATYEGDPLAALEQLQRAADADPDSAPLRTRLAMAYLRLGQLDRSAELATQAIRVDPEYGEAHHLLGRLASYAGDLDAALEHQQAAIEHDPSIDSAWRDLILLRGARAELELRAETLERYLPHAEDEAWALRMHGETLRSLGRSEQGLESLRRALEIDPEDRDTLAAVLSAYEEQGRTDEAIGMLEDLVHRFPSSLTLREELARAYAAAGRYEDAIDQLRSEYEQDPDNRYLYAWELVTWYERLMRHDEAEALLVDTLAEFPDNTALRLRLGWVREEVDDLDGALAAWEAIDPSADYWITAIDERARVLVKANRTDDAMQLLRGVIDDRSQRGLPPPVPLVVSLARLLTEAGELPAAKEQLAAIVAEAPGEYARELARIYARTGQLDRARMVLDDAIQIEGVDPTSSLALAQLYRDEGLYELAIEVLVAALERLDAPDADRTLNGGVYPTMELREAQIQTYKAEVLVALGFLRGLVGDSAGALDAMFVVLSIDRDDVRALNFIGYTFAVEDRDLAAAENYIRQALVLDPLDPAILDSLGWVYFRQGRLDEALEVLEQSAARMDDSAVIWQHLGETYRALNRHEEARESLQRALEHLDEDDPEAVEAAARARRLLDQYAEDDR